MDLNFLRQQIDDIDRQLLVLFQQRMAVVEQVARYKQAHGLPVRHPEREAAVLDKVRADADAAYAPYAVDFFRGLMALSRQLQGEGD